MATSHDEYHRFFNNQKFIIISRFLNCKIHNHCKIFHFMLRKSCLRSFSNVESEVGYLSFQKHFQPKWLKWRQKYLFELKRFIRVRTQNRTLRNFKTPIWLSQQFSCQSRKIFELKK